MITSIIPPFHLITILCILVVSCSSQPHPSYRNPTAVTVIQDHPEGKVMVPKQDRKSSLSGVGQIFGNSGFGSGGAIDILRSGNLSSIFLGNLGRGPWR